MLAHGDTFLSGCSSAGTAASCWFFAHCAFARSCAGVVAAGYNEKLSDKTYSAFGVRAMARGAGQNGGSNDGLLAVVLRMLAAMFVIGMVAGAFSLFATPAEALAAPYEYSSAKIDARVETDGDLRVNDQRILDYSASSNEYVQEIAKLADNQLVVINSIRVAPVDDAGNVVGEWTKLSPVAFKSEWRRNISGAHLDELAQSGSYAYDMVKFTVHLYYPANVGDRLVLDLDYSIVNGALAYKDVGEVNIKYVGESFIADSRNVMFSLSLPVPEGGKAVPDTNVRAWGHGPQNGVVDNQGSTIIFTDDYVKAGQYAEAHVVFPSSWLTNISGDSSRIHKDEMHLSWVLKNEEIWQDSFRYGAITDDRISLVIGIACVFVLLGALLVYRRFGRDPKASIDAARAAQQGAQALRELRPAVAARFLNDGVPSDREFAATALRLRDQGLLSISSELCVQRRSFDLADDSVDAAAMGVFEALEGDSSAVELRKLDAQALRGKKDAFLAAVRVWDAETAAAYKAQEFVEPAAIKRSARLRKVAVALLFAALFVLVGTTCYLAVAILVLTALGVLGVSCETHARTQEAANLLACIDAYRTQLLSADVLSGQEQRDAYVLGLEWEDADPAATDDMSLAEAIERSIPAVFEQIHRPDSTFSSRISAQIKRFLGIVKQKRKKPQAPIAS